jgi:hypothetical protein
MSSRVVCLVLLAAILTAGVLCAQEEEPVPEPYDPEEFSQGLRDLRRAEIIAIGSFPITFVFANLGYSLLRYAANGGDPDYAPVGSNRIPLSRNESLGVLAAAAAMSVTVAVIDYGIGRRNRRRAIPGTDGNP